MAKEDFSVSFALGLLGGVIGGVVLGALFAPKPGDETRQELKEKIDTAVEEYTPKIICVKNKTIRAIDILRCRIEKQVGKINNSIKAKQLAKAKIIENGQYEIN